LVVATVCIGAFIGQLDASIVSIALPAIGRDLGGSTGQVEWVALSYLLTLVAPIGRLADSTGRKLLYTYGFAVFGAASVGCALAGNLIVLDAFRVLQAVGAAMLQANSVALISLAVPRARLGRSVGVQGAAQALGLALGPAVGGLLLEFGSWRLLFVVNLPASVLGLITAWFFLPRSRFLAPHRGMDWTGLALFVPAVAAVMLGLSLATEDAAPWALGVLAGATLLLGGGFVRHARRHPNPALDITLFRSVPFAVGLATGLLSYTATFGLLFTAPDLLETTYGLSHGHAGLTLTCLPAALALTAPLAGGLADRIGTRWVTTAGMVLATGGLLLITSRPALPELMAAFALVGVGMALFTPANNAAIMSSAPTERAGTAAGILNMTRGIGTALGVAAGTLAFTAAAGSGDPTTVTAADAARGGGDRRRPGRIDPDRRRHHRPPHAQECPPTDPTHPQTGPSRSLHLTRPNLGPRRRAKGQISQATGIRAPTDG
jgi:EmrB/QacA subfamily drug resistance transporter